MDADKWTDAELRRLEAKIAKEYKIAGIELKEKAERYFNGYDAEEPMRDNKGNITGYHTVHHKGYYERKVEEYQAMQRGVYSDEDFKAWMYAQLGRGEHWEQLRDQMADRLNDANKIAQDYTNGILPKVYANNSNYVAQLAQDSAMEQGVTGIRFDLVDEYAVKRLMENSHEVRPYKPVEISVDKNTRYSKTKMQSALLQGILQGDSVQKIATRFEKLTGMQRACAIRNARTAVTGARNAGKQDRFSDLASKGVQTTKKWKATADERTRTEHMQAWADYGTDDKAIPYDEPFDVGGEELMYPADEVGSPWNIYNCRCTMAIGKFKFNSIRSEYSQKVDSIRVLDDNEKPTALNTIPKDNISNDFVPAKTIKEAEEFIAQYVDTSQFGSVGLSYTGVSVDVANEVNKTLFNFFENFNVGKLGGISAPAGNTKLGKMISDAIAGYAPVRNSLLLNRSTFKTIEGAVKSIKEDNIVVQQYIANPERYDLTKMSTRARNVLINSTISGRGHIAENVEEAINHELGHFMEKYIDMGVAKECMADNAKMVSGYATDGLSEYVAECFASYLKGENVVDRRMISEFEKVRK